MFFVMLFDEDCGCSDSLISSLLSKVLLFFIGYFIFSFTKEMQKICMLFLTHYGSVVYFI